MAKDMLLDRITTPHQLRRLNTGELKQLADELRNKIVDVVSRNGGHLASNLGVTELTIALHYVFDFSHDRLLWDVGHQCYAHKILTGRGGRFDSLRQSGGISGFPDPSESDYDLFCTGHAGTAISTATGLAWADQQAGSDTKVIAVVGDGSIVNGPSMEGLNNSALLKRQFLVILNDNSMAIDRTQGAMAHFLDRIRMTHTYTDIKHSTEALLHHLPLGDGITEAIHHIKAGLKTAIHGEQIFESFGLQYFGPMDGHNINELIRVLRQLADLDCPALLHVHTVKGAGCEYAVEDPCRFHSTSAYHIRAGQAVFEEKARPTWTQTFSEAIVAVAAKDQRVVAITAAMPDGTGLVKFRETFPSRCIDVGISESHAVAMAAGLAKAGSRPVIAIYTTFLQRAVDQIFQEVTLQGLPVIFCTDRAGLVGSDGPTHHGFQDIAQLRTLPGMVLMAPAEAAELPAALQLALSIDKPCAIRYPRDEIPPDLPGPCPPFELARARIVREGRDATLLCYGVMVEPAMAAAELMHREDGLEVAVINARFAKPLDTDVILDRIAGRPTLIVEDHAMSGGFGSAVLELAAASGLDASNVRLVGIPDRYISHASRLEQMVETGLDAAHLATMLKDMILQTPAARSRQNPSP